MFNSDLVDDLARGRVVLFLGAGVSASATTATGGRIPDWETFLTQCATKLIEPMKSQVVRLLEEKDYLLASEIMQLALQENWVEYITHTFGQKATPSSLHRAIAQLRQRIIITTNFDKLLEAAWEANDTSATHYPNVISDLSENVFKVLKDHAGKYIIKIHGTVDNPQSLIFSRSEYIRSAFGSVRYHSFLESLLLNYTFIFLGFSLNDPAILSLMELYALRYPSSRPHYIFSSGPIETNIIAINKRLRKLNQIVYDPKDGHQELVGLIKSLGKEADRQRRNLVAEMLSVQTTLDNER